MVVSARNHVVDVLYFSVYSTQGDQYTHSQQYSHTMNQAITTSFPQMHISPFSVTSSAIDTPPPPPPPVEILHSDNSTGIISSIRRQLDKPDVIELSDTLEEDEEDYQLVSNEEFNSVGSPKPSEV